MEGEKLYGVEDDGYVVLLPNKHAWDVAEIRKIFSEFGEVINIKCCGDETGFRFIKYKTLEEVTRCIEGCKNDHRKIRLLPVKRRQSKNNNNNNSHDKNDSLYDEKPRNNDNHSDNYRSNNDNSSKKPLRKPHSTSSKSDDHCNGHRSMQNGNRERGDHSQDEQQKHSTSRFSRNNKAENSDTDSSKMPWNEIRSGESNSEGNSINSSTSQRVPIPTHVSATSAPQSSDASTSDSLAKFKVLHKVRGINSSTFSIDDNSSERSQESQGINTDEIPDLVCKETISTADSSLKGPQISVPPKRLEVIPAIEVIVANIHENFGVHYILHLMDKFEPIAATVVESIPQTAVRFSHVYFKTARDAKAVEEKLNNYCLSGQELIVMRAPKLLEEADM